MKVLITGGAGFIGSHLCDRLLGEGHSIACVDNFITGSEANIAHLLPRSDFQLIRHDITKALEIPGPVDVVLHFASPASPIDYLKYPIQTLKVGSLGTLNALGIAKAKRAKFLLASTSEVYGDPQVHPQTEAYWGHVNPVGPRGVYDEAKRFAEAATMAYHREHEVDTHIVRIFNSILANETVMLFNDHALHLESIGTYVDRVESRLQLEPPTILVPTFDPISCRISLAPVSAVIKHPCQTDCYALSLRYGRTVKVTGDHSVFSRDADGRPVARPVRQLQVGDHVAIPARLPVVERDVISLPLAEELMRRRSEAELWDYVIQAPSLRAVVEQCRQNIHEFLMASGRFTAKQQRNAVGCALRKYWHQHLLPLAVVRGLGISIPPDAKLRIYKSGAHIWLPATITVTNDLLWLIGFFVAEGCSNRQRGKSAFLTWSSDGYLLDRAAAILTQLGCHVIRSQATPQRGPALFVHSQLLYVLFDELIGVVREKRIPAWVMQLPLARLKYVLEGYREGDGTHSGKKIGHELCFDTVSGTLATDLIYLLLRFGIVASVGQYRTTFRKKYGDRRFPFFRITICEVDNFNVLTWDCGVRQTLNARRVGDLVWSKITAIEPCEPTNFVYDFSVPGTENFVAGNGVFCHNTYGPRMRLNDGRAVPTFIGQAMRGEPLTVFGDGSQTRSFCYVDDLVEGLRRLMQAQTHDPVNLGNPDERTLLEIAEKVLACFNGASSRIVFRPLPTDDPKQRRPDLTRARTLLGWAPAVPLEQGLQKTIQWFVNRATAGAR